jgi:hypothetical protein
MPQPLAPSIKKAAGKMTCNPDIRKESTLTMKPRKDAE